MYLERRGLGSGLWGLSLQLVYNGQLLPTEDDEKPLGQYASVFLLGNFHSLQMQYDAILKVR